MVTILLILGMLIAPEAVDAGDQQRVMRKEAKEVPVINRSGKADAEESGRIAMIIDDDASAARELDPSAVALTEEASDGVVYAGDAGAALEATVERARALAAKSQAAALAATTRHAAEVVQEATVRDGKSLAEAYRRSQHAQDPTTTVNATRALPESVPDLAGPPGAPGITGQSYLPIPQRGPVGPTGPEGPPGFEGRNGTRGMRGPNGTNTVGRKGAPGYKGEVGPRGPAGPQGVPGPQGAQGPQGLLPQEFETWQHGITNALARLKEAEAKTNSKELLDQINALTKRLYADKARLGGMKALTQDLAKHVAEDNWRTLEAVRLIVEQSKEVAALTAFRASNKKSMSQVTAGEGYGSRAYDGHDANSYGASAAAPPAAAAAHAQYSATYASAAEGADVSDTADSAESSDAEDSNNEPQAEPENDLTDAGVKPPLVASAN